MTDKWDTPSHVMRHLNRYKLPGWVAAVILAVVATVVSGLVALVWMLI